MLIRRINVTNLATEIEPGVTVTDGLARRDVLRLRHRMVVELADAASAQLDRFTRTELRSVAAVDVRELRRRADELARLNRELDTVGSEPLTVHHTVRMPTTRRAGSPDGAAGAQPQRPCQVN